jgi:F420-non-reducing hydrogenase iron-sulfur subunit
MSKEPTIVVFACSWDALSCIEAAAQKRMTFPSNVKIIRVNCLSRVHTGLMLKAFELGADGVMLLGCDSHNCHFGIDEELITQNYNRASEILSLLGLKQIRLCLVRLPHGDASGFIERITDFTNLFTGIPTTDT